MADENRTETAERVVKGTRPTATEVGRTWLCDVYHELLRLPGGCFSLFLLCFGLPVIPLGSWSYPVYI